MDRPFIPNKYTLFLSKVETFNFSPDKCWLWLGAGKGNGYGNVRLKTKNIPAHRYAYSLFCGEVKSGMDVCHTCDNRSCVNPDHLFLGTRQDNMADCKSKGRTDGGIRKKLTEKQVQEIRRRLNAGLSARKISNQMDVNYYTITGIKGGRTYVGFNQ